MLHEEHNSSPYRLSSDELEKAVVSRAQSIQDTVIKRAIRQLKDADQSSGRQLPRDALTYIRYVNERFLEGLSRVMEEGYALKGGNALTMFQDKESCSLLKNPRETRDIDLRLVQKLSSQDLRNLFYQVVRNEDFILETGLYFGDPQIYIQEGRDGLLPGAQVTCPVFLGSNFKAGRSNGTPFKLEITFGSLLKNSCAISAYPTLAELAAQNPCHAKQKGFSIPHVVPEAMWADKFHAIARHGLNNTRLKDIFDLYYLQVQYQLDSDLIRDCVLHVFSEFKQEHLITNYPNEMPGLNPLLFATQENETKWHDEWKNWTGVEWGMPLLYHGLLQTLDLGSALNKICSFIIEKNILDKRVQRQAGCARLLKTSLEALMNKTVSLLENVNAADVKEFSQLLIKHNSVVSHAAVLELYDPYYREEKETNLVLAYTICNLCHQSINNFLERWSSHLDESTSSLDLIQTLDNLDLLMITILESADSKSPIDERIKSLQVATLEFRSQTYSDYPLKQEIHSRCKDHLESMTSLSQTMIEECYLLFDCDSVDTFQCKASQILDHLNLSFYRNALNSTRDQCMWVKWFAKKNDEYFLEALIEKIDKLSKDLDSLARSFEKAVNIHILFSKGSSSRKKGPQHLMIQTRKSLVSDAEGFVKRIKDKNFNLL